jgi:hypothetical protein
MPGAFPTTRGDGQPLTPQGLKALLVRLGKETGIHVHAHKFRHTFASRAIAAGVDPITLQRVLGHTTLTMVSRYVHYSPTDLLDAWQLRRVWSYSVSVTGLVRRVALTRRLCHSGSSNTPAIPGTSGILSRASVSLMAEVLRTRCPSKARLAVP